MIDTRFIIRYTNGLYATKPENAPRYDEFRDMLSSGQLASKEWAVRELSKVVRLDFQHVIIAGAWFGTLGMLLKHQYPNLVMTLLDIDPRCEIFLKNISTFDRDIFPVTEDMYKHIYTEDIVVNTSCEHIPDVKEWLKNIRSGTTVLLQSNNNSKDEGHINCVYSENEFIEKAGLSEVLYSGQLVTPMYTRYMIIGKK